MLGLGVRCPHKLLCLSTGPPGGAVIWEGCGTRSKLVEAEQQGQAFKIMLAPASRQVGSCLQSCKGTLPHSYSTPEQACHGFPASEHSFLATVSQASFLPLGCSCQLFCQDNERTS